MYGVEQQLVDSTALVSQATFTRKQQAKHCHVHLLHNILHLRKSAFQAYNQEILSSSHTVAAFNTSGSQQASQAWLTQKLAALNTQASNQGTGVHALSAQDLTYNSSSQSG